MRRGQGSAQRPGRPRPGLLSLPLLWRRREAEGRAGLRVRFSDGGRVSQPWGAQGPARGARAPQLAEPLHPEPLTGVLAFIPLEVYFPVSVLRKPQNKKRFGLGR